MPRDLHPTSSASAGLSSYLISITLFISNPEKEYEEKYGKPRPAIEHVVVLMLENRTFDNVLGVLLDRRMKEGAVPHCRWRASLTATRTSVGSESRPEDGSRDIV